MPLVQILPVNLHYKFCFKSRYPPIYDFVNGKIIKKRNKCECCGDTCYNEPGGRKLCRDCKKSLE
jgi:hypothetical protein